MKPFLVAAALAASASATIDFNKLINGISSFPIAHDVDNSLNIRALAARQATPSAGSGANQAYLESVCSPNIANPNPIPPCISINTIQTLCQPNGTSPLAYQAHAQCLCGAPSSFFQDWLGCRRCLVFHGGLSEREFNYNRGLLAAVSTSLCSGTPTTDFAAYFATATIGNSAAVGATTSSDSAPSQSAVSLYYSPSGPQGPGSITGPATAATGSARAATTASAGSSAGSGTTRTNSSSTSRATSGSAAGSSGFAAATAAPMLPALMALGGIAAAVM